MKRTIVTAFVSLFSLAALMGCSSSDDMASRYDSPSTAMRPEQNQMEEWMSRDSDVYDSEQWRRDGWREMMPNPNDMIGDEPESLPESDGLHVR